MPEQDRANHSPPHKGQPQPSVLDYAKPANVADNRQAVIAIFVISVGMILAGWHLSGWLCLLDILAYSLMGLGCLGIYVSVMAAILAWWQRK
jgi:hypothetical protein